MGKRVMWSVDVTNDRAARDALAKIKEHYPRFDESELIRGAVMYCETVADSMMEYYLRGGGAGRKAALPAAPQAGKKARGK